METLRAIELKGSRIKELLFLARLFWCKFHLTVQISESATQVRKSIVADLRFIELEKKVDRFTTVNEIILEAPEEESDLLDLGAITDQKIDVSFQINDESYYFSASLKDIFVFCDKIPVISLDWPEIIYKQQSRMAERMKNLLPDELTDHQCYVKDISVSGFSFFYTGELDLEMDQKLGCKLLIPIFKKTAANTLAAFYYEIQSSATVLRQVPVKERYQLYGCQFNQFKPPLFLLIRQYIWVRLKEEAFFEKNQYYPKFVLPEIKILLS